MITGEQQHVDRQPSADSTLAAKRRAAAIIDGWPSHREFDANELLGEHAELAGCRSILVDFAYEEFCRKQDAGQNPDPVSFAHKFPQCRRTLLRLLGAHDAFRNDPDLSTLQWPKPGGTFLGFQLLSELGRGSFARVFLAEEIEIGHRVVVVKVCGGGANEANVLGKLKHAHIGEIYSVQHDPATGLSAICMPFVAEATLTDQIDNEFARGETHTDKSSPAHSEYG